MHDPTLSKIFNYAAEAMYLKERQVICFWDGEEIRGSSDCDDFHTDRHSVLINNSRSAISISIAQTIAQADNIMSRLQVYDNLAYTRDQSMIVLLSKNRWGQNVATPQSRAMRMYVHQVCDTPINSSSAQPATVRIHSNASCLWNTLGYQFPIG